jgi:hypothetical protein
MVDHSSDAAVRNKPFTENFVPANPELDPFRNYCPASFQLLGSSAAS